MRQLAVVRHGLPVAVEGDQADDFSEKYEIAPHSAEELRRLAEGLLGRYGGDVSVQVLTSPAERAQQSAAIIATVFGVVPVVCEEAGIDAGWYDVDAVEWDQPLEPEDLEETEDEEAVRLLAERLQAEREDLVVVVTHQSTTSGLIGYLTKQILGCSVELNDAGMARAHLLNCLTGETVENFAG